MFKKPSPKGGGGSGGISTPGGSYDLPEECGLSDHYDILTILRYGKMGKIYLAAERVSGAEVVLKAVYRDVCRRRDIQREYHYATNLDQPNLSQATGKLFQTDIYFVYPMQYAPFEDLASYLCSKSLDEVPARRVTEQMASALSYLHSFQLIHNNVCPENILIYRPNLSLVRLTDFGTTYRAGTFMRKRHAMGPYSPPELSREECSDGYYINTSLDVWALGILIIQCLIGTAPWSTSEASDQDYITFKNWQRVKSTRVPKNFRRFTVRLLRLLRRLLEPSCSSRYPAKEVFKYLDDNWLIKSRDRSDSNDLDPLLVPLSLPDPHTLGKDKLQPKSSDLSRKELLENRVSTPRRFLSELLRLGSPNISARSQLKSVLWHRSSSSSSSSSSFSRLNLSSSVSSFTTSTNYSSV